MGAIIEFKRPERLSVSAAPTEPKRRIAGALFADTFDEVTRWLIDPGVLYEDRAKFINNWRETWGMEPI